MFSIEIRRQRSRPTAQPEPTTIIPRQCSFVCSARRVRGARRVLPGVGALPRVQQSGGAHGHHQAAHYQGWCPFVKSSLLTTVSVMIRNKVGDLTMSLSE